MTKNTLTSLKKSPFYLFLVTALIVTRLYHICLSLGMFIPVWSSVTPKFTFLICDIFSSSVVYVSLKLKPDGRITVQLKTSVISRDSECERDRVVFFLRTWTCSLSDHRTSERRPTWKTSTRRPMGPGCHVTPSSTSC